MPRWTSSTAFAIVRPAHSGSTCRSARRGSCCRGSCRLSSKPIPISGSTSWPRTVSWMCWPLDVTPGIRYDERLEQDMIAVPIGPRRQRFATAASPSYLDRHGRPAHPRDLLSHACLGGRFASGATTAWEFEREGEVVRIDPSGPLIVRVGAATDLAVDAAIAGTGIITLFEDWLRPHLESGVLEPVLEPWWQSFSGPFPVLSGPALPSRAAEGLRRLHRRASRSSLISPRDRAPRRLLRGRSFGSGRSSVPSGSPYPS